MENEDTLRILRACCVPSGSEFEWEYILFPSRTSRWATAWTRTTTTMLKGTAKTYGIQTKLPKKRMEEVCPMHDSQSGSPSNLNAL